MADSLERARHAANASAPPTLQERVATAILDAAAVVIAADGEHASMSDVAAAAGVARATVYRYFGTRAALIEALAELAVARAGERLDSARVGEVGAVEGISRAVRAMVDVGAPFVVLARERVRADPDAYERLVASPLRQVIERGQRAGELRADIPPAWLCESVIGLVAALMVARPGASRDDVAAAATGVFLDGTRIRQFTVTGESRPD